MNKIKRVFIVLAAVLICVCLVLIAILSKMEINSIKYLYAEKTNATKKYVLTTQSNVNDVTVKETDKKEKETTKVVKNNYEKYVFVGDSRYKGMSFMADDKDVFICESGRGYDYLLEQMDNIKWQCDKDTALIIGLGVNDNGYNVDEYLSTLKDMADTMDCTIYYMLVNPVDEAVEANTGYNVLNDNIDSFNERMQNELDSRIKIIDTNSYLLEEGFNTVDGLHYTDDTYSKIYWFIKSQVENN